MSEEFTTPEEYVRIRQEHIVAGIYGGNDRLALEEKERLLMQCYPESQFSFHSTTLDKDGRNIGDGHVRTWQKVAALEHELLFDRGLIKVRLC